MNGKWLENVEEMKELLKNVWREHGERMHMRIERYTPCDCEICEFVRDMESGE